jgi:hypothetical protein
MSAQSELVPSCNRTSLEKARHPLKKLRGSVAGFGTIPIVVKNFPPYVSSNIFVWCSATKVPVTLTVCFSFLIFCFCAGYVDSCAFRVTPDRLIQSGGRLSIRACRSFIADTAPGSTIHSLKQPSGQISTAGDRGSVPGLSRSDWGLSARRSSVITARLCVGWRLRRARRSEFPTAPNSRRRARTTKVDCMKSGSEIERGVAHEITRPISIGVSGYSSDTIAFSIQETLLDRICQTQATLSGLCERHSAMTGVLNCPRSIAGSDNGGSGPVGLSGRADRRVSRVTNRRRGF